MARKNEPPAAKRQGASKRKTTKQPVIDNTRFPSTEEVGRLLGVPPERVRQLKELAAKIVAAEPVR
jgi:hypothetical protein